ncbi:DUF4279 domain-containing protein [Streptomyces sp. A0592]|uniref:DUF4279 domain-containing protein n=1 Tax=Streptomyces sp. A0592 TaxID=2563099 RepID=UPI00109E52EE|nr:DUF4279 domain-containing protein [Streptomyces sp. A0592]THA81657.1 DUF4279 domain-containing protein [Streptomyces sp. A0592]
MPIDQYVYFALSSKHMSAEEMTAVLGLEPDETLVRGSRRAAEPTRPACHSWKVVCREPGLAVDEQIDHVLDRLRPHTDRIAALARQLDEEQGEDGSAVLEVVRYFRASDADTADATDDTDDTDATHSPNLFGWALERDVMEFLIATGAVLDVDEYDMTR